MFDFEIMPAPFVLSRLQVWLTMQALDAPMSHNSNELVGVYLTNALTGWENVQGNIEEEGQQPPQGQSAISVYARAARGPRPRQKG